MVHLFAALPGWLILVLFILVACLITFLAIKLFQRLFSAKELEKFKDVTGIYVSMIGVLYGVFLAFIVIAIWESYDHVKSNIDSEADSLGNMYRDAKGLPPGVRYSIDSCVKAYVILVTEKEWPLLSQGQESKETMDARTKLQDLIISFKPKTLGEQTIYAEMISNLNQLTMARRIRVNTSNAELPLILWVILIGGALLLIFYIACFYMPNQSFHLWLSFGVSGLMAILLFVAFELNYPFVGSDGLKPEAFISLKSHNVHKDVPPPPPDDSTAASGSDSSR